MSIVWFLILGISIFLNAILEAIIMNILTTKTENCSHRKILITGSSGFVGKHLVKRLSEKHKIIRYDLVNGQDVLNEKLLLQKLKDIDVVIHLAAFISAMESWKKPVEYIRNNALGTATLVNSAIKTGVKKLIFFSSAAVKAKPLTPYAVSKISAEKILDLYKDKINMVIVRPENIYGPGQKEAYGYVIHNFIKAVKYGNPIKIYGDGKQTRDFIYISDVVDTIEELNSLKMKTGTVISIGTGKEIKIVDLANIVSEIFNKKPDIEFLEKRDEPLASVADLSGLKRLGVKHKKFLNIKDGIKKLTELEYSE